ncbi:uncharacterized protein PV09_02054 [Verruconis gallopava]|uniref:Tat pathway signal sequence n=1 Tax=Verruconis gallopava TaxID=253628 RepID=A0A0D2AK02_9PEZI|nr:uncharacterized protein PV09_02054 [Verruconis gallopava]KIW07188.1 hypothetical protein PV09_02054 [Verruconis gallopava]
MAYDELPQSPYEEPETLNENRYARRLRRTVWLLALSSLLNIALAGWAVQRFWKPSRNSYENGFETDLKAVKSSISLVKMRFDGGVKIDKNGTFVQDQIVGGRKYTGKPSLAVDLSWFELLSGLNIDLSGDDADGLAEHTLQWPDSDKYFSGLEVFHSLHCLNRLRQALYPEHYSYLFKDPKDPSKEDHIDHCIEHLRQAIQCHADLTPMHWARVDNAVLLKTDTEHTCRDFDSIWNWAKSRRADIDNIWLKNGTLHIVD